MEVIKEKEHIKKKSENHINVTTGANSSQYLCFIELPRLNNNGQR